MTTRPAMRYYGGKWRIAPWIISHLPPHTHYVEPFGGAASVLLHKPPSYCETYNDLDGEIVSFFRVLRDQPDELIRLINLTPYARDEHRSALSPDPARSDLERARRLYVRTQQSRGNIATRRETGWRAWKTPHSNKPAARTWTETGHLYEIAARLASVQIENRPALDVIRCYDHPETLFYCDPPYPQSTRSSQWSTRAYAHEMSDDDHRELAHVLHQIAGMAIVSCYRCALYDELYHDWRSVERSTVVDNHATRIEILYLSPHCTPTLF